MDKKHNESKIIQKPQKYFTLDEQILFYDTDHNL